MDEGARRGTDYPAHRIVSAALELLSDGGRDAVTTRAIGRAAGVQAPTIYRIFGDKESLLDAVVVHGFAAFQKTHSVRRGDDPVTDLRGGWDAHVEFGLSHPYLYSLMFGDARPGRLSPAAADADRLAAVHVHRIAEQGRLRMPEERAVRLVRAAGSGTTLALIAMPEGERDASFSELARETAIAAIISDPPTLEGSPAVAAAAHLRAVLPNTNSLSEHERLLLQDWLDRIAGAAD